MDTEPSETTLDWIGRAGWALFLFWTLFLVIRGYLEPEPYADAWRLVMELALMGQLVSVADGVASGFSGPFLIVQNVLQDWILLLVLYPWIVRAYRRRLRFHFIGRRIDELRRLAERHSARIQPFGALGLWAFVFFPFWTTGPLVGGAVGYLIGLRTSIVLLSVFIGHALSVSLLVVFFDAVHEAAESFSRSLAAYLPWMVGFVWGAVFVVSRFASRRRALSRGSAVPSSTSGAAGRAASED